MAKPKTKEKDPRTLAKGAVIWHPGNRGEEVVRDVSVVLHLANGESRSYRVGTDVVELVDPQPALFDESEILEERAGTTTVDPKSKKKGK